MKMPTESYLAISAEWLANALAALGTERNFADENSDKPLRFLAGYWSEENDNEPQGYTRRGSVALLPVRGVMEERGSYWSYYFGGCSTEQLVKAIDAIETDPNVSACVPVFDTPGGTVSGTANFADALARLDKSKPVVGYVTNQCCSAGLWAASQCRELNAGPTAIVGSIGVLHVVRDSSDAAAKAGVKVFAIGTSPHKGAGTPGTTITDAHKFEYQRIVNSLFAPFKAAVQDGRGLTDAQMDAVADARVWVGQDAVQNGLLDRITSLDDTIAQAAKLARPAYYPGFSPKAELSLDGTPKPAGMAQDLAPRKEPSMFDKFKALLNKAGVPEKDATEALDELKAQIVPATPAATTTTATPAAPAVAPQISAQLTAQTEQIAALTALVGQLTSHVSAQKAESQLTGHTQAINDLVRQKRLSPAQAEGYRELAKTNADAFAAVLPTLQKAPILREIASEGHVRTLPTSGADAGAQLVTLTQTRMKETKEDYATAFKAVLAQNPTLAQSHQDSAPSVAGGRE